MKKLIAIVPLVLTLTCCGTPQESTYAADDRLDKIAQGQYSYSYDNFNELKEGGRSNVVSDTNKNVYVLEPKNILEAYNFSEYSSVDY